MAVFNSHYNSYRSVNSSIGTESGSIFGKKISSSINDRAKSVKPAGNTIRPDLSIQWKVGDKAKHSKWGVGTIVSVKGSGEEVELQIAFPGQGIKALMQNTLQLQEHKIKRTDTQSVRFLLS